MKTDTPILSFHDLGNDVLAFSTTRRGGYGSGNYAFGNINPYCGDNPLDVEQNLAALAKQLNIKPERILLPHQTHETAVLHVSNDFLSKSFDEQKAVLEGIDAIATNVQGVCVGVSTADCVPILLYDMEHRAVCAVHAGWRGTVRRIVQKAVLSMQEHYATKPSLLRACIAPAISAERFEVGDEVYQQFEEAHFDMPKMSFHTNKWHIDLPRCNQMQLEGVGVKSENITRSPICTYTNAEQFFSARRLGTQCGRIYNGIMLR